MWEVVVVWGRGLRPQPGVCEVFRQHSASSTLSEKAYG